MWLSYVNHTKRPLHYGYQQECVPISVPIIELSIIIQHLCWQSLKIFWLKLIELFICTVKHSIVERILNCAMNAIYLPAHNLLVIWKCHVFDCHQGKRNGIQCESDHVNRFSIDFGWKICRREGSRERYRKREEKNMCKNDVLLLWQQQELTTNIEPAFDATRILYFRNTVDASTHRVFY